MRLAILSEAGTDLPYRAFALGALTFEKEAEATVQSACTPESGTASLVWEDDARDPVLVHSCLSAVGRMLASIRDCGGEFRVVVCRKEGFYLWERDRQRGFDQAVEFLEDNLRVGAVARPRRERPRITDSHRSANLGVRSGGYLGQVPTDVNAAGRLDDVHRVFSLFVSAVASDTNAALQAPQVRTDVVDQASHAIAEMIGVEALRNDSWPTTRQEVPGDVRHNIWHFPEEFRGNPGLSRSIIISPTLQVATT